MKAVLLVLRKDLRVLLRSPLLLGALVTYPIVIVIWKLSDSLAWSAMNADWSFLISQITSGPMMWPSGMMYPASAAR